METRKDSRIEKGKQTRQAILKATFELLVREGPKSLTAGKISAKAGVSKAILFHHFDKVDDIPFGILEELFSKFSGIMSEKKARSISDYVYEVGRGLIEGPEEQRKITAAMVHFYVRAAHDEAFRVQLEKTMTIFLETLAHGFEDVLGRKLTSKEREIAPLLVTTCMEGMGFLLIPLNKEAFRKTWKTLSHFVDHFLTGGGKP